VDNKKPMSGAELQAIRKRIQAIQWFADKLKVSKSTLESYESGRLPIPAERAKRVLEIAKNAENI
jgi:DNA-binding transcriptional regulator YiaG